MENIQKYDKMKIRFSQRFGGALDERYRRKVYEKKH